MPKTTSLPRVRLKIRRLKLDKSPYYANPNVSINMTFSMAELCEYVSHALGIQVSPYAPSLTKELGTKILDGVSGALREAIIKVLSTELEALDVEELKKTVLEAQAYVREKHNTEAD